MLLQAIQNLLRPCVHFCLPLSEGEVLFDVTLSYNPPATNLIETKLSLIHQAINRCRMNSEPLRNFLDLKILPRSLSSWHAVLEVMVWPPEHSSNARTGLPAIALSTENRYSNSRVGFSNIFLSTLRFLLTTLFKSFDFTPKKTD